MWALPSWRDQSPFLAPLFPPRIFPSSSQTPEAATDRVVFVGPETPLCICQESGVLRTLSEPLGREERAHHCTDMCGSVSHEGPPSNVPPAPGNRSQGPDNGPCPWQWNPVAHCPGGRDRTCLSGMGPAQPWAPGHPLP